MVQVSWIKIRVVPSPPGPPRVYAPMPEYDLFAEEHHRFTGFHREHLAVLPLSQNSQQWLEMKDPQAGPELCRAKGVSGHPTNKEEKK